MKWTKEEQKMINKGITLVALVVTIVVLLILAGITIIYVMGNNGVFGKASEAKLKVEIARYQEMLEETKSSIILNGLGTFDQEAYFEYIEKQGIIEDKETDVINNNDGTYDVTTRIGYVFLVTLKPNKENPKDAEISYLGIAGKIPETKILVESITLSQTEARMNEGENITLIAIVKPDNSTNKNVTWESSNPDVATVSSNGLVTAVSIGEASITAKATDGSEITTTEPCLVTVEPITLENIVGNAEGVKTDTVVYDKNENQVVIPAGFRVLAHETEGADIEKVEYKYDAVNHTPCVQDGIVIADNNNNQFVWIPVGTINDDKEGNKTTIILGRYSAWGPNPTPVESADTAILDDNEHLYELKELTTSSDNKAYAQNLQKFINNANKDHGYWFGRYEASAETVNNVEVARVKYNKTPWTMISHTDAFARAVEYRTMQNSNGNYLSDLINSYMWDTAIVFIERYASSEGIIDYANKRISENLQNTGTAGDDFCNIHDMSGNCIESSTETATHSIYYAPFSCRGGPYRGGTTSFRWADHDIGLAFRSFRLALYSNE